MATHSGTLKHAQLHGSVCRPSAPLSRSTITSSQMSHMVERLALPGRRASPSRPSLKSTLRSSTAFSLRGGRVRAGKVRLGQTRARRFKRLTRITRPKCPRRRGREEASSCMHGSSAPLVACGCEEKTPVTTVVNRGVLAVLCVLGVELNIKLDQIRPDLIRSD